MAPPTPGKALFKINLPALPLTSLKALLLGFRSSIASSALFFLATSDCLREFSTPVSACIFLGESPIPLAHKSFSCLLYCLVVLAPDFFSNSNCSKYPIDSCISIIWAASLPVLRIAEALTLDASFCALVR